MEYRIDDSHQHYIKIVVNGALEKDRVIEVIKDLVTHPEYEKKHSLWDMANAEQGTFDIMDIREIVGFLRLYRPKRKDFADRSVFIVASEMNRVFVNIYITLSKILPFKYHVCTELSEAEAFLVGEKS